MLPERPVILSNEVLKKPDADSASVEVAIPQPGADSLSTEDVVPEPDAELGAASLLNEDVPMPDADSAPKNNTYLKIIIGKFYSIRRSNGTMTTGRILHARCLENATECSEFYVHYMGHNRRLDEWVKKHRVSELITPIEAELPKEEIDNANMDVDSEHVDCKMARIQKRRNEEGGMASTEMELEREHISLTKIKYIEHLVFGLFEIKTWYYSPFPDEYEKISKIYVCQFCLKYMQHMNTYSYHYSTCKKTGPPGKKVYQDGKLAIYEVDGAVHQLYCQLLCLTAKLFLDHKTLFFDTAPFLFYLLCEIRDDKTVHILGYFSKEKNNKNNNVACILILPPYQRKGYGKLMISYSYELSRRDGIIGSPENPLSDLGRLSYRGYWAYTLLEIMKKWLNVRVSIKDLSEISGITKGDIMYTLSSLKMVKYWHGEHTVCVTRENVAHCLTLPQYRRPKLLVNFAKLGWERRKRIPPNEDDKIDSSAEDEIY